MENLKKTPLFEVYEKYGGKIIDFAGWALPVQYEGITQEHETVRNMAGLFDVSHMGEVEVKGKDALAFVNHIITNDASVLVDNQVLYTPMCNPEGGVVDDILVYRFTEDYFYLVINAGNIDKDYQWMLQNKGNLDCDIKNISGDVAEFAIQGPLAEEILQSMTETDLSEIKFFYCKRNVKVNGFDCLVSRTGYTGEDGFEVFADAENAIKLWDSMLQKGHERGLKPAGLGARDTLRFEVALPLYGNELLDDITPLEAGISMFVKLDKKEFIGKEALVKQKAEGLRRKIVGFELNGRGIPRHGYEVKADGNVIGHVTTGYLSPSLKKSIGLALVDIKYTELGTSFSIMIRNKESEAVVCSKRFYKKNYKK